ncbi:MAG: hypothetical protein WDN28_17085 [Chthoniobacter sp.]
MERERFRQLVEHRRLGERHSSWDAAGDIANLTFNITTGVTVTIDGAVASRTVATLNIGDTATTSNSYTLAASGGGTLTFDNGGNAAVLNQNATSNGDTITAPILLNSQLNITNASPSKTLTISGGITSGTAGTKTITIGGHGRRRRGDQRDRAGQRRRGDRQE